eukprot:jgi/Picre1/28334/NNA_003740.t1
MRRCVKRSVTHVLHEDTTTIPSVRTTRRSSKRQRVAQASSEDSALTSSILVPHNGDKAAVDATTRQQTGGSREGSGDSPIPVHLPPGTNGERRPPKEAVCQEDQVRVEGGGGHQDRVGRGAALPSSMRHSHRRQRCDHAQVVAAAESLVLLKHTVPSKRGSKRGSKPRSKVPQTSSMWSNLDLLATAACDMSGTQRATRRGLRSRS